MNILYHPARRRIIDKCMLYGLHFDTYSNNLISLLTIGNLVVNSEYTIGDYLIEWHLNSREGSIVLYSGIGTDPLINIQHPFSNEPVESGILYPILKYIYIDGIRYVTNELDVIEGDVYDNNISYCLPDSSSGADSVGVNGLTCYNGSAEIYSHLISYNNELDEAINAQRTVRYELSSDVNFIAYKFNGYEVVDEIEIKYVSSLDPLNPVICSNWRVGLNAACDFESIPKVAGNCIHSSNSNITIQQVINLRNFYEYNNGDYLLIKITPRVLEPSNQNTNWDLYLKCLDTFEDYIPPINCRELDISSIRMEWSQSTCQFTVYFKFINSYITPYHFKEYLQFYYIKSPRYYTGYNPVDDEYYTTFPFFKSVYGDILAGGINICSPSYPINYTKIGNTLTITFDNISDYNIEKDIYDSVVINSNWTNYNTDDSNINHFKYWRIQIYDGISCGDTIVKHYIYTHKNSNFIWSDIDKTCTIPIISFTNNYPIDPLFNTCDTGYSIIESIKNTINEELLAPDFNITVSSIKSQTILVGHAIVEYNTNVVSRVVPTGPFVQNVTTPEFCEMFIPTGWDSYSGNFADKAFGYITGDRIINIIDDTDPINNFEILNHQNITDGTYQEIPTLEYRIENGIITYPV